MRLQNDIAHVHGRTMLQCSRSVQNNQQTQRHGQGEPCTEMQKLGLRHAEESQGKANNSRLDYKANPRKELKGKVTSKSLSKLRNL